MYRQLRKAIHLAEHFAGDILNCTVNYNLYYIYSVLEITTLKTADCVAHESSASTEVMDAKIYKKIAKHEKERAIKSQRI